MVIITVEIFRSEIEQKLSKGRIFQFLSNEKNYNTKNETGELFSIFDPQPYRLTCSNYNVMKNCRLRYIERNQVNIVFQQIIGRCTCTKVGS